MVAASLFCSGKSERVFLYATFIFVSLPCFYYLGIGTQNSTPNQGMNKSNMIRSRRDHGQTKNTILTNTSSRRGGVETGKFATILESIDATQLKKKKHSVEWTREVRRLLGWRVKDSFVTAKKKSDDHSNISDEKKNEEKVNTMIPREINELNFFLDETGKVRKQVNKHQMRPYLRLSTIS